MEASSNLAQRQWREWWQRRNRRLELELEWERERHFHRRQQQLWVRLSGQWQLARPLVAAAFVAREQMQPTDIQQVTDPCL